MNQNFCRWGILGAAFIARKNWQSIRDAKNAVLIAVASRDIRRAQAFISECQTSAPHQTIPEALGCYDELLARTDIDAVYIPLPTGLRKEWVLKAARAGKHVLVEKPVGCDASEVAEIIATCEEHGVQFMDGVMFMHGQRLHQLRQMMDQDVGAVRHIATQFSFKGDDQFQQENIRAQSALEPLGCLGDLGWYCLRFSLWAMQEETPIEVTGRIHSQTQVENGANSVPLAFSGNLIFASGASASFYCCFTAAHAQWAIVSGENAVLHLNDFVLPFSGPEAKYHLTRSNFIVEGCRADMHEGLELRSSDEPSNNASGSQESRLFETFSDIVINKQRSSYWPKISLLTQRTLDACLDSAKQGSKPVRMTL